MASTSTPSAEGFVDNERTYGVYAIAAPSVLLGYAF